MDQDQQHLKLLSIFHYIVGGLAALFACIPLVHFFIGIMFIFMSAKPDAGSDAPPAFIGWIFVIMASFIILSGWTLAVCIIVAGRNLAKRTRRTFCTVVACIECIFMPFGTVLGVFTIIVLMRQSVVEIFAAEESSQLTS